MRRWSWLSRLTLLLAGVAALVLLIGAPASAGGVVLRPGRVVEIAQPGTQMTVPADGRLRGEDFTARVTGVAWPTAAGVGTRYTAAPGDRLVVFTLRVSQAPGDVPLAGPAPKAAVATLEVAGIPEPVDLFDTDAYIRSSDGDVGSGADTYVAAVPARSHAANLTLTEGSFSQSLSLWTLRRIPPEPPVLYRDLEGSSVIAPSPGASALTIANPTAGESEVASIFADQVTLGWFAPDPQGSTPSETSSAILTMTFSSERTSGGNFFDLSELPGERLTFTPTGGSAVTAQVVPGTWMPGSADLGLLDGTYWFIVPGATTTGTLAVTSGPCTGTDANDVGAGTVPLEITSAAPMPINVPPPAQMAAQRTPTWSSPSTGSANPHPAPPTTPASASTRSSNGGLLVGVLAAIVVAVAVFVFFRQRRRRTSGSSPGRQHERVTLTPDQGDGTGQSAGAADPIRLPGPDAAAQPHPEPAPADALVDAAPGPARIPVIAPRAGPVGDPHELVVRVLGPVEITGWQGDPPGGIAEELACYLALHPRRPVGTEELAGALWPVELEVDIAPKTLRNHLSRLRAAVGADRLPEAGSTGYRLEATTDWELFTGWAAEAKRSEGDTADRLRAGALGLVRGEPFTGVPAGRYSWVFAESLASDMVAAVVSCAHRLSVDRLTAGDTTGGEAAARAGLRASPSEEQLWLDAAAALTARGDAAALSRLTRDAQLAAGADVAHRLRAQPSAG